MNILDWFFCLVFNNPILDIRKRNVLGKLSTLSRCAMFFIGVTFFGIKFISYKLNLATFSHFERYRFFYIFGSYVLLYVFSIKYYSNKRLLQIQARYILKKPSKIAIRLLTGFLYLAAILFCILAIAPW